MHTRMHTYTHEHNLCQGLSNASVFTRDKGSNAVRHDDDCGIHPLSAQGSQRA